MTLDPAVKIAINFVSQSEIVKQPSVKSFISMLVRMIEFQTAKKSQSLVLDSSFATTTVIEDS